jgi:hypothetical protein
MKIYPEVTVGGIALTEDEAGLLMVGLSRIIHDPERDDEAEDAASLMQKLIGEGEE